MTSSAFPSDLAHVGGYDWPRAPTTSSLKAGYRRIWEKLRVLDDQKADLMPDDLERLSGSLIPDDLWTALREFQFKRLDEVYLDWARHTDGPYTVCAFVTMPSVPQGILVDWAKDRGLDLVDGAAVPAGQGALIVPDLSALVRRNMEGRAAMRAYLAELDGASRNVLLGVSSWTWTYLAQTSAIEAVVSDARSFAPFNDKALAELIGTHMSHDAFKSAETGKDILSKDDDGALKDSYLKTLAARAFGCPWAALRLFDAAVNRQPDQKDKGENAEGKKLDEQATWLQDRAVPQLPNHIRRPSHFLLHALLIHGPMAAKDVGAVLPMTLPVGLPSALGRAGLVDEDAGMIAIREKSYPHVRRILSEAGFPLDLI
ncbi:hypothetical protein MUY35_04950 [Aliiroseovarius sp. S1339]|uniref:hypothetical protein n=1 Tax=Aliiroseovarius sp. S1339 TaxID=2936990 RepID=UPI0020BEAFB7|nr:hypothetical protein [Aliiroseovarius sp. S1339]MCK8463196.1 hypothetical protein [Aliiroseovarius sp. S1339]